MKYPQDIHMSVSARYARPLAQAIKQFVSRNYGFWPDVVIDGFDCDDEVDLIVAVYTDDDTAQDIYQALKDNFALQNAEPRTYKI